MKEAGTLGLYLGRPQELPQDLLTHVEGLDMMIVLWQPASRKVARPGEPDQGGESYLMGLSQKVESQKSMKCAVTAIQRYKRILMRMMMTGVDQPDHNYYIVKFI